MLVVIITNTTATAAIATTTDITISLFGIPEQFSSFTFRCKSPSTAQGVLVGVPTYVYITF